MRVFADGVDILLARDSITEPPKLGARGANFQVKPAPIAKPDGFLGGFGVADFCVGERHSSGYQCFDTRQDTR